MPEKDLFEYAVIRIVPRVEREEFINAGVVLYCKSHAFLKMQYTLDEARLHALAPGVDINDIRAHLEAFEQICMGNPHAGPIARLDITSRFRWLTAKRSTVIQTSEVHGGICNHPEQSLKRLHDQLVPASA